MTINEIIEFTDPNGKQIKELPAEDAVLFLWVTSPILPECFSVIEGWGFRYTASFIWDKIKHNWGHYNSVRHEFLLICAKGTFLPQSKELHDSVVSIERSKEHSEKPDYFRDEIIEKMYPRGKWIELFARYHKEKRRELEERGWILWGAQI
jgi:N6-adenosine-specific RNA methylase IME4